MATSKSSAKSNSRKSNSLAKKNVETVVHEPVSVQIAENAAATIVQTEKKVPKKSLREIALEINQSLSENEIGLINGIRYPNARAASIALWKNGEGMSVSEMEVAINMSGIPVSYQTIGSYTIYANKVKENKMKREVLRLARTGKMNPGLISERTGIAISMVTAMIKHADIQNVPNKVQVDEMMKAKAAERKAKADAKIAKKIDERKAKADAKIEALKKIVTEQMNK